MIILFQSYLTTVAALCLCLLSCLPFNFLFWSSSFIFPTFIAMKMCCPLLVCTSHMWLFKLNEANINLFIYWLLHVDSQFPDQGSHPWPLHWEHEVLTTGLLGKCQAKVNLILISSVTLATFQVFRSPHGGQCRYVTFISVQKFLKSLSMNV